jgi:hypothetical protein
MQRFLEYLDKLGRDVRQRRQAECALDIGRQGYWARYAVGRKILINSSKDETGEAHARSFCATSWVVDGDI